MVGVDDPFAVRVPAGTPPVAGAIAPDHQAHPNRHQGQPVSIVDVGRDAECDKCLAYVAGGMQGVRWESDFWLVPGHGASGLGAGSLS
jgi:hypothetical protein